MNFFPPGAGGADFLNFITSASTNRITMINTSSFFREFVIYNDPCGDIFRTSVGAVLNLPGSGTSWQRIRPHTEVSDKLCHVLLYLVACSTMLGRIPTLVIALLYCNFLNEVKF